MKNMKIVWLFVLVVVITMVFLSTKENEEAVLVENEKSNRMTFFVTSRNPGNGANFGGLVGADNYCQSLASSVGAGDLTWKVYLSTQAKDSTKGENARDRIGNGPWHNAQGILVAGNVDELHKNNTFSKQLILSEGGTIVSGRGDTVNVHDILTGSTPEGTASTTSSDTTCNNWTSGATGAAMVGHHDRMGLNESESAKSWNSSHLSRGCSLDNLKSTGGGGLLYCFALKK